MSTSEFARPDAHATGSVSTNRTPARRPALVAALLALVILIASSCEAAKANTDYAMVNGVRARSGAAPLARSTELDVKAAAHAQALAANGTLYHSKLAAGVSDGWKALGENVAYGSSVESAQQNLEASAPHLANMVNPAFTEIGIGVRTVNGMTYVVQVFAGR